MNNPTTKEGKKMAKYSQAQNEATKRYQKKVYDNVRFTVPKGFRADVLKPAGEAEGMSVNAFILKAVLEKIDRDKLDLPVSQYIP